MALLSASCTVAASHNMAASYAIAVYKIHLSRPVMQLHSLWFEPVSATPGHRCMDIMYDPLLTGQCPWHDLRLSQRSTWACLASGSWGRADLDE
jgi:hypothetical protein